MKSESVAVSHRVPWNKGKLTGQKVSTRQRHLEAQVF